MWLGLCSFTAEGLDSISGQETKISQASWHDQKKKDEMMSNFMHQKSRNQNSLQSFSSEMIIISNQF